MPSAWTKLVEQLGEEGARAEMRRRAENSSRNSRGTGGFAYLKKHNPEKLKEIGRKYGRSKNTNADSV